MTRTVPDQPMGVRPPSRLRPPDAEGPVIGWLLDADPFFAREVGGRPGRWNTLRALRVLGWYAARPTGVTSNGEQVDGATRVDQARRTIRARPSNVYQAFASREALASWLPPKGMTGDVLEYSFREGGGYRMRLTYDQPNPAGGKTSEDSDEVEVTFVRLETDRRIEQRVVFASDAPEFAGSMKMTWSFTAARGETEVSVRCEDVPPGIRPEDHEAGLASTLENLARFTE